MLKIEEADGNVVLDVPLTNLVTGIALRDKHMKEKYLEVQKSPGRHTRRRAERIAYSTERRSRSIRRPRHVEASRPNPPGDGPLRRHR